MPEDEHYFGLGDKAGGFDRRNQAFVLWNTDAYAWQESTDPLYKSVPFVLTLRAGSAYGLFFDNTYRGVFDFGHATRNVYSFGAEAGPLDYYFVFGPPPKQGVERFSPLTRRHAL